MDLPLFFISDIHLMLDPGQEEPGKQEKLFQFLDHVSDSGGTLFIVGDLFDFWFEYEHLIPKIYFPFLNHLHSIRQKGVKIHYLLGNHDFWVREFITDTLMDHTYTCDVEFELAGKNFYITHGDGLLSWDRAYRVMRWVIRNPVFIWLFGWLHPNLGYRLANWISRTGHNYMHSDEYNQKIVDDLMQFASEKFSAGFDYLITGHYHQTRVEKTAAGQLVILGDWINYFSYAVFDGKELSLESWK